jgi:hypothetical protein
METLKSCRSFKYPENPERGLAITSLLKSQVQEEDLEMETLKANFRRTRNRLQFCKSSACRN